MSENSKEIKAIFSEALEENSVERRDAYLDSVCGNPCKSKLREENHVGI